MCYFPKEKLEKLLQIYPPEDVEARRWEKIARALGNRTPKQVLYSTSPGVLNSIIEAHNHLQVADGTL